MDMFLLNVFVAIMAAGVRPVAVVVAVAVAAVVTVQANRIDFAR
jgi:hypothetical protein